ncbi:MAG: polysaccharide pyruvyl transferase family protein [Thermosynechococcaceae cyanobacterium]
MSIDQVRQNIFFISARIKYENLGDLLINRILVEKLRDFGQIISDDRGVPDSVYNLLGLKDSERLSSFSNSFVASMMSYKFKLNKDHNSGVFWIKTPGGYHGSINNFLSTTKSIAIHILLKVFNIHICTFGISVGPYSKSRQIFEKWKANCTYFYAVRDSISQDYAKSIGIDKVLRFPDLALMSECKLDLSIDKSDEYIIFSFRESTNDLDNSIDYQERLFTYLSKIVELVSVTWGKRIFVCYQVASDYEFCSKIYQKYRDRHNIILVEEQLTINSICDIYSKATYTFSNRLHVLLFSGIFGSIPVAVIDAEKHRKINGIYKDMDMSDLIIDISNQESNISETSLIDLSYKYPEKFFSKKQEIKKTGETILNSLFN